MSKNKTMIEGGEYHLLDLQESINGLLDEFHKRIPVDNDEDFGTGFMEYNDKML